MSDYNVLRVVILLVLGVGRQLASMGDRFARFAGFLPLVICSIFVIPLSRDWVPPYTRMTSFILISVFNFSVPQTVPRYNRVLGGKGKDGLHYTFRVLDFFIYFSFFRFISLRFSDFYFIIVLLFLFLFWLRK